MRAWGSSFTSKHSPVGAVTSPGRRTAPPDLACHDGLPAFGHCDVLDDDPLRAAGGDLRLGCAVSALRLLCLARPRVTGPRA